MLFVPPRITFIVSVMALVAAGTMMAATTSAQTATTTPSVPTSVTATPGDTEALISWSSGGAGVGGTCATTQYYVELYTSDNVFVEESDFDTPTSWYVDELTASTDYKAFVWAYGKKCDDYSATAGEATFTTTAAQNSGDPTAPSSNPKKIPRRARDLTSAPSGTSVTLTWKKPNVGNPAKRCQPASTIDYALDIVDLATEEFVSIPSSHRYGWLTSAEATVTVTVNGLTSGKEYEASVGVYSPECREWSRWRYVSWTQP